jgi:hypothetical protein
MRRFGLPLSLVASLVLAACAPGQVGQPTAAAPAVQPQEMPYRAGSGVVQSAMPAPAPLAAAGATAPAAQPGERIRLAVRMDDGRIQYVDAPKGDYHVGQRVELTPDRMIKPAGG